MLGRYATGWCGLTLTDVTQSMPICVRPEPVHSWSVNQHEENDGNGVAPGYQYQDCVHLEWEDAVEGGSRPYAEMVTGWILGDEFLSSCLRGKKVPFIAQAETSGGYFLTFSMASWCKHGTLQGPQTGNQEMHNLISALINALAF